ncbi:conjugal transfer protein, partial [Streptomyces sp. DW26H14]|uniref:conjugal transfer protein n=1 Tax=Streptomyces sp. DW26H14 TaxID=3435395 RepID=UPI00403DE446
MEPTKKKLTWVQAVILGLAVLPMIAVGIAGGIGTYSNIGHAYGSGTAIGALAAGEGATAVLAFILLGVTLLGQSAPKLIRVGLWALPGIASVMGATAATEGVGQTIVYAATPMAMTAAAEGLAFLARRIVVHQDGRDVEAEARAAEVIRDLAYHQARAAAHPSKGARKRSVRKSWRLARKVGHGDATLGADLLDVQHARLVASAGIALERMFQPGMNATAPAILPASADTPQAILPASADDATTSRTHDTTVQAET